MNVSGSSMKFLTELGSKKITNPFLNLENNLKELVVMMS